MLLARVVGNIVATQKHKSLLGQRLLLCQPETFEGKPLGAPLVAIDQLGAGLHQRVNLTSDGLTARSRVNDQRSPARYVIIGVLDN
ncbi:MAG: EutN/CcmL family microcompartment protein [Verrucomicrobia bacterium]|jgi:microcompartment protein CcmK/EutM|nr:EutN/CcmL family microcompartment protein [Verrucomicrobiota bacterium]